MLTFAPLLPLHFRLQTGQGSGLGFGGGDSGYSCTQVRYTLNSGDNLVGGVASNPPALLAIRFESGELLAVEASVAGSP